tara:strand:- start:656 stop:1192 length:537 start_codon:yes stop_codon:yes gene_type:complete
MGTIHGQEDLIKMYNKIIVTGPECSGKTTLCNQLKTYFNLPTNNEFARHYLKKINKKYIKKDLTLIAKKQLDSEKNKVLLDTDLITIKIWSNYKYNSCDKWIIKRIHDQKTKSRFYFLCKGDLQWKQDGLRENQNERDILFELYKKELEQLQYPYFIIEGENRFENAKFKLKEFGYKA